MAPSDIAVLDDFEDGDGKPFKGYQREAFWYTATDHSAGSTLAPEGNFMPARLPARESSKDNLFAAHVTAAGQTEWGALFATTLHFLKDGVRCPLNLSLFRGVKFRAKGPGSFAFRMDVPGTMPPEYGGECSKSCYDAPSKVITLSDHWDEYSVTWDQLQQGGWGTEVRFEPARVLGLGFTINLRALPADFWSGRSGADPEGNGAMRARACVGLLCAALLAGCAGSWGSTQSPAAPHAAQLLPARVRLLSNFEYEQSVRALVGDPVEVATLLPPELRQAGYTRSADQVVSEETLVRLNALATRIAHDAVSAHLATLAPCTDLSNAACAEQMVDRLGRRAFRRPLTADERATLLSAFASGRAEGQSFASGVELALGVLLVSPSFLYTTELGLGGKPGQIVTLEPYEIASELSYTLQGGPPDETLLGAAQNGTLLLPGERERQARRLIADSGTRHQFRRFVLEWLEVDTLEQSAKASSVLADYDELKSHMLDETKAFVDEVMVHHGGSVHSLLSAGFASVDPVMARFYGLHGYGPEASLAGSGRIGILQQASFLAAHAHEDSSSPVKRGDFVLRRLLCETVKRPGEVGINIVFPDPLPDGTTRQRFDVHTASPECAGCHQKLDQIGFSFEDFDAAGRRRQSEHGRPIETQADFRYGDQPRHFADSRALSLALAGDPEVRSCFARQAFRYFSAGAPAAVESAFLAAQQGALGPGAMG